MKKYVKIMRIDHWIKQMFIIPGSLGAIFLAHANLNWRLCVDFVIGFFATCAIASANYVINEWLDAEFDQYHPTKKYRTVVTEGVKGWVVWTLWAILSGIGFFMAVMVAVPFLVTIIVLWIMGLLYNVKPIRTKDIPFLDVLSESVNNALRLLLGWFIISSETLPPSSIVFGYWMAGAFLMAVKRYAEYRMINDKQLAGNYRKSFKVYTEKSLLISAFFYAMCSTFFIGVFLIKYRVELILLIPALIGLYCYYFYLSFMDDSSVQKPEKLFREKGLMGYCVFIIILFLILLIIDIPQLSFLTDSKMIYIREIFTRG